MKVIQRCVKSRVFDLLKVSPVVFLNGPRQAGKSTLVQGFSKKEFDADYITFDSATQMAAASLAPIEFLTSHKTPLIIDEVQLVPELVRSLKIVVDEMRVLDRDKANGQFLLTGSANILALPKLSNALVGRMSVHTLYPFSSSEAIGGLGNGLHRIFARDFSGLMHRQLSVVEVAELATFPEISGKDQATCSAWFEGYLTTILQRDVKFLADLEKIHILPTLLRVLSTRAGSLMNDAEISRDVGLNPVTEKFYRKILQMMFLAFDVPPWFKNIGKRLTKASKGYIIDTLLLSHMLGYQLKDLRIKMPNLFGHIIENFVAVELTKLLSFGAVKRQLLHFRTSDGKEVDFVIENQDGSLIGIEVKTSENIGGSDFKGLHELQSHVKENFIAGVVLYSGKEVVPFGRNLWAIPFHILWQ